MPSALCVILYIISGPYRPLQGNAPRSLQTLFMSSAVNTSIPGILKCPDIAEVNCAFSGNLNIRKPLFAGILWAVTPPVLAKIGQPNNWHCVEGTCEF
jgi:hypothetical protein